MAAFRVLLCQSFILVSLFSASRQASPSCTSDVFFVTKDENIVVGTEVITLSTYCSDADAGDSITYSAIESGNTNDFFQLDTVSGASTGKIEFKKSPDAEDVDTNSLYTSPFVLVVSLTDTIGTGAGPIKVAIVVYITSLNDNNPVITNLNAVTLDEDTAVGTIVGTCTVTDGDYSGTADATTTISITGGNTAGHFAIRSDTCDVTLIKPLDYETTTSFELVVQAVDAGSTPATASATLTVTVGDVNDNPPVCSQSLIYVPVPDGSTTGTSVATLVCSDVDGGSINYAVLSGDTTRFSIDTAGEVTLAMDVDTEGGDTWLSVVLAVTDTDATVQTTTVTLSAIVEDVDDNVPSFGSTTFAFTVSESVTLGTIVDTFTVTDADGAGAPSTPTFAWAASCTTSSKFVLDPTTGNILVADALSAATDSPWSCDAEVYTADSTGSIDTTTVTITITAINADVPVFEEGGSAVTLYEASVQESPYPSSSAITTVTATDTDTPLTYTLVTSNTPFDIDVSSGVISQITPVDYESNTAYLLVIRATDSGTPVGTSTVYVRVSVTPVNDFDPSITTISLQTVDELDSPGAVITTVTATDADSGDDGVIRYSLLDTNVPFILEPVTGNLLIADGLDADTNSAYILTVVATDQSSTTARSSTVSVTVTVTDSNDNAPTCNSVGDLIVTPNTNIGTFIGQLVCTDLDSSTQTIRYTEASGDTNDYFLINNVNGEIRVRSSSTAPGTYNIMVDVTDGGTNSQLTTTIPLVIKVEVDLAFNNAPLTGTVAESTAISSTVMNIQATGAYDAITYSIESGDNNNNFHLDQSSGDLVLRKALDRETLDTYNLVVRATTTNSEYIDSTLDLIVSDDNDEVPAYANSYYTYTYSESTATPISVATLTATDADLSTNALVTYSILSGNENSMFAYDSDGKLYINAALDYETAQSHTLVLQAVDKGTPENTGTTIVYIIVDNEIDNTPQIVPTGGLTLSYLPEDTTVGSSVYQVDAGTQDMAVERSYEILMGQFDTAGNVVFYINENNGTIYLAYPLDRETDASFSLGIQVTNTNNDVDTATLDITVFDENDNDPVFESGNYVFEVEHDTAVGTTVGQLGFSDLDEGANGSPTLSIFSGDSNNHFSISGEYIVTTTILDANTQNQYDLIVTATDGGTPPRATNATVAVIVADEFLTPTFSPTSANTSVDETQTPGLLVYDCDGTAAGATEGTAETGDLYYSFTSGNNDAKFFIEPYSGTIQLVGSLDFSTTPTYTLEIQGANINQISVVSTFTLTISVAQINQVTPEFAMKLYSFSVIEDDAAGTAVGTVAATDSDPGDFGTVSYSLETTSNFLIDATTGAITTNGVFEYSNDKSFHLEVYGIDDAGVTSRTGTSVVIVSVTDTNNHAPTFASSPYTYDINEALSVNSPFLVLAGADLDYDAFGTLNYVITLGNDNGNFSINDTTGVLSVAAPVDYENGPQQYILEVEANDGGTPSLTGTATVTINVLDTNDEAPVFNNTRVEVSLNDTTAFLTSIWTVTATDADSTAWHYTIQSGNTNGLFAIDVDTGVIQAVASLETIASDFYELEVIAVDEGSPQLTGTTIVAVTVQPILVPGTTDYTFSVEEEQASPELVDTITGLGALGTVSSFTIVGGNINDAFTINANGEIYTAMTLDAELIALYVLTVDIVASVANATYTVRIDVTDINDNAPVFETCPIFFSIVENFPAGNTVGTISVVDGDTDTTTNGDFSLEFASPFYDSFFTLSTPDGLLTVDRTFNKEGVYNHFEFNVLAIDNGVVPTTSTCSVTVSIIDVVETLAGYNGEVIDYSAFISAEIPHDLAIGSTAYTLSATDFNMTGTGAVSYKSATIAMNGASAFTVDAGTGAISVADNLYMYGETTTYFHWVVCEQDNVYKVGLVRIDTFEKNDNMVALVTSSSTADVIAAKADLLTNIQAKFTSPVAARIFEVRATDNNVARRRLLTTESAIMVVAVADDSVDNLKNVDVSKTFLGQEAVLAALQSSSDGTPVTGLDTSTITVNSVDPYDDGTKSLTDTPLSHPTIIAMVSVGGVVGFAVMIGVIVFIAWCCLKTRNAYATDEERIADMEWVPGEDAELEEEEDEKVPKKKTKKL